MDAEALENQRLLVKPDITLLNALPSGLGPELSPARRTDVKLAIPRIKLALMSTVWEEDWGNYYDFERWIKQGEPDAYDDSLQAALALS